MQKQHSRTSATSSSREGVAWASLLAAAAVSIAASAALMVTGCSRADEEASGSTDPAPAETAENPAPPESDTALEESAGDSDDDILAIGRQAYNTGNCQQCHGGSGAGGMLGPDLTDDEHLHTDGSIESIRRILVAGVPKEEIKKPGRLPMPPVTLLIQDDATIDALAAYVASLSEN